MMPQIHLGPSFCQSVPPLVDPLNVYLGAISRLLVSKAVQRDVDRTAGRRGVPDKLQTRNGFAPGPLPDFLKAPPTKLGIIDLGADQIDHVRPLP